MVRKTTFQTTILGIGNNTGIEVPEQNIAELAAGKRPPVQVDVDGYTYVSTVAVMRGAYMLPLAKAHREASGLRAGDEVTVTLQLEEGPRQVEVPAALQAALDDAKLLDVFEGLSYSRRKEYARQVTGAKADETKLRRIAKVLEDLRL